jgi:hypothetical protein
MQTVQFECGHCGQLMAVVHDCLGQQVRCPHCQQIVLAPVAPPTPPAEPTEREFAFRAAPSAQEQESIFGEHVDDDLFGAAPKPILQMPPGAVSSPVAEPPSPLDSPTMPLSQPLALVNPFAADAVGNDRTYTDGPPSNGIAPGPTGGDWPGAGAAEATAHGTDELPPAAAAGAAVRRSRGTGMFSVYLLSVLVPYAIFATALAIYFYFQWKSVPHPLEYLQDIGDPKDQPSHKGGSRTYLRIPPDTPLPDRLKVSLGQSIRVGDLEVKPERVTRERVVFRYRKGGEPERADEESLVLHLRLKNVSADLPFKPTDPAFAHWWKPGLSERSKPYTYVEVGAKRRFYGGPKWHDDQGEYVVGQEKDNQELPPGEERTTVICTDPADQVPVYLDKNPARPLWRVQLRRGLVSIDDHEVSATFVIGVEFDRTDVKKL